MNEHHPENILPSGPGELSKEAIQLEIANDRYAVVFSAGTLALSGVATAGVAPELVSAISESQVGDVVNNGVAVAFVAGVAFLSVNNIAAYGKRWVQARFNQRLMSIAEANDIDPSAQ